MKEIDNTIGLILAAGFSSRAKGNKMLFEINGKYLLLHTIERTRPFVKQIYVVTGHYDKEIREALKDVKDIKFIYNANYEIGMYSSILAGLKETAGDILLIPGDTGFVKASTYEAVLSSEGAFRSPIYQGVTGHPIFISHTLREDILNHPNFKRMKQYRDSIGFTPVPVDDPFITRDVDTLEDLENLKTLLKENNL